ncbi:MULTISPECIES: hypothetical protein [unclassified Arthrobacter]|uniref:hypothetical protein n=1 Tax=unclassified Arthrobacter TaxID=235627 RepID=UPI0011B02250|nr:MULTISPECIES: hypothetical protein [unclassified Arthrobacter]
MSADMVVPTEEVTVSKTAVKDLLSGLSGPEKSQLSDTIGCVQEQLHSHLEKYARAALEEYSRMVLGQKVYTRGSDVREYRLYLLIRYVYDDRLPSEKQICETFQVTSSQARSLLRAVMSKFQYELKTAIDATLLDALNHCVPVASEDANCDLTFTPESENIVTSLNEILGRLNGNLQPIVRQRHSVNVCEVNRESYQELMKHLAVDAG